MKFVIILPEIKEKGSFVMQNLKKQLLLQKKALLTFALASTIGITSLFNVDAFGDEKEITLEAGVEKEFDTLFRKHEYKCL